PLVRSAARADRHSATGRTRKQRRRPSRRRPSYRSGPSRMTESSLSSFPARALVGPCPKSVTAYIYAPLAAMLLLAWWLRVVGLGDMHLSGDSAYSLQVAGGSLAEITFGRVSDAHPPLSYSLLHLVLPPFGATVLGVRLPSSL